MSGKLQAIRGMHDLLPAQAPLWNHFERTVREVFEAYGYREIRFPIVEQTALFVRSIGEATDIVEKEMYSFVDRLNGDELSLRPEGTACCIRAALEHNLLYEGPQRLWYGGAMFRHERPAKGRYRQFHQFGVEALGYAGPDVDAEQLILCARLWRRLDLSGITLEINTLGSQEARLRYRRRLVGYFEGYFDLLGADEQRRLGANPLRILDSKNPALKDVIAGAPKLLDDLDEGSLKHFEDLQALLRAADVAYTINPRLVRGLDYYNATVFEWVTDRLGAQSAVCSGGRYDALIEQLGGKPAPGCGFALGVERLIALLEQAAPATPAAALDVYLAHQGELALIQAAQAAETLRDAGLKVALHCGGGNFKSQLKKADTSAARFAIIIGDDEISANVVSLKPLRGQGEQMAVGIAEAVDLIKRG
jgi:histidyl-tRNA synthetase